MSTPPAKLVSRPRTKWAIALACAATLGLGALLAPPRALERPAPERVAPILEAEVQRREPARLFRTIPESARGAMRFAVAFPALRRGATSLSRADFEVPSEATVPAGFGVPVPGRAQVLTRVEALQGRTDPEVRLPGGARVKGTVAAYDVETGLALVSLPAGVELAHPTPAAASPLSGELVVAAGRSDTAEIVAPVFVVSTGERAYTVAHAGVLPAGVPLFNLAGELVGVAAGSPSGLVYRLRLAVERLDTLAAGGRAWPSTLGLYLQRLTPALQRVWGERGALVSEVVEGGPADRAGVRHGDTVLAIGGEAVESAEAVRQLVPALVQGAPVALRVRRERRELSLEAVPERAPSPGASDAERRPVAGPPARQVFAGSALEAAGIPAGATVLAIGTASVRAEAEARAALRRARPPWIVYLQNGGRRFYAVVEAAE